MTMIFFVKITVKLALLPFFAVLIEEIEDSLQFTSISESNFTYDKLLRLTTITLFHFMEAVFCNEYGYGTWEKL